MNVLIRTAVFLVALLAGGVAPLTAQQAPGPTQQNEFIPIDQLPPQERLPAAPLLVGAYAFALAALAAYLLSVARRLSAVQKEVDRLESDMKKIGRA